MIKEKLFFCILFVVLMSVACVGNHIDDDVIAEQMIEQVFDYLKKEDAEGLKELFSKNVNNSYNLEEEIRGLFEFVDGSVISYSDYSTGYSSEKIESGEQVYLAVAPVIRDIVTDTEKTYKLSFFMCVVDNEDANEVGISTLKVMSEDEIIYYVGEK